MLWNPHYGGIDDFGLPYSGTYVEWLGTSVQLVQDTVSLHTVWSICVPIALIEAFDRGRSRPWLGRIVLITVSSVFVLGSAFLAFVQIETDGFVASAARYIGTSAVILSLTAAAFVVGRRPLPRIDVTAPSPWLVGAVALAATSLVMARQHLPESVPAWLIVAGWFGLAVLAGALVLRWSRCRGWGDPHRLALAKGTASVGVQRSTPGPPDESRTPRSLCSWPTPARARARVDRPQALPASENVVRRP
jgi:hypothetical protein